MGVMVPVRLGSRRRQAGCSQQALAARVGISRQALNAIEGGRQSPSVVVALALARELRCRVEDLFGEEVFERLEVELVGGRGGSRVAAGQVGGRWVAHALGGADYEASDGVVVEVDAGGRGRVEVHGGSASVGQNVLVAGCAPLLATLARGAGERFAGVQPRWIRASSGRALELLERGLVHIAGLHTVEGAGGGNAEVVRRRFGGQEMLLVNLITWRQGLLLARGNPMGLRPDDLGRPGVRLAWREEGSGARRLLMEALGRSGVEQAPGGPLLEGHMEVGMAVASGAADAGVAIEAAAVAFGLDFIPMSSERFDLALPLALAEGGAGRVLDKVDSAAFRAEAAAFGGYGVGSTGQAIEIAASGAG